MNTYQFRILKLFLGYWFGAVLCFIIITSIKPVIFNLNKNGYLFTSLFIAFSSTFLSFLFRKGKLPITEKVSINRILIATSIVLILTFFAIVKYISM